MKKIRTIYEKDIYPDKKDESVDYMDRLTSKAIIFDGENKIALVGNKQNNVLQIPGGGIDSDENIKEGAIRECLEETGYPVSIIGEIGIVDDYRSRDKKHCITYCYLAKVSGIRIGPKHTSDETEIGMYTKWVTQDEALNIFKKQRKDLEKGKITFYNTGFNIARDLLFLKEMIANNKNLNE